MEKDKKEKFWPLPNCRYCLGWGGWDMADSVKVYWQICGACEGDGIDYSVKENSKNETN